MPSSILRPGTNRCGKGAARFFPPASWRHWWAAISRWFSAARAATNSSPVTAATAASSAPYGWAGDLSAGGIFDGLGVLRAEAKGWRDGIAAAGIFTRKGKRPGFAAWNLLFYALWHQRHILGLPPEGDVFETLAAKG